MKNMSLAICLLLFSILISQLFYAFALLKGGLGLGIAIVEYRKVD